MAVQAVRRLPQPGTPPVGAVTHLYCVIKAGPAGVRILGQRIALGQVFSAIESQVDSLLREGWVVASPAGATAGQILTSSTTPALPVWAAPSYTPPS